MHNLYGSEVGADIHILTVFLAVVVPAEPERGLVYSHNAAVFFPLFRIFTLLFGVIDPAPVFKDATGVLVKVVGGLGEVELKDGGDGGEACG